MQQVEASSNSLLVINIGYLASEVWKSRVGQFDWKSDVLVSGVVHAQGFVKMD